MQTTLKNGKSKKSLEDPELKEVLDKIIRMIGMAAP
jgi:hypothetical protein